MFKHNGIYYLSCADQYDGRYSCLISTSNQIYGPYSPRYEAIPHGGHNIFFQDFQGQWWSTYFGSDKFAPWQEVPGLIPIDFDTSGKIELKTDEKSE